MKMRLSGYSILLALAAVPAEAQFQNEWTELYGGAADDLDTPRDLALDSLGNVVVVGQERVVSNTPNVLIPRLITLKYDPLGALLWSRLLVPASGDSTSGYFVRTGPQDDIFVAGILDAGPDWVIARYDSIGNQAWELELPVAGNSQVSPRGMVLDDQGSSYIVGQSVDEVRVTKIDAQGSEVWTSLTISPDEANPTGMALGLDNDLYVVGWARVANKSVESALWRLDRTSGQVLWVRTTGTDTGQPTLTADLGEAVAVDANGNALVLSTLCFTGFCDQDVLLQCIDSSGSLLWETVYDAFTPDMHAQGVALDIDGAGAILVAAETRQGSFDDILTLKFDPSGQLLWEAVYAGAGDGADRPDTIAVNGFGEAVVTGDILDTGSVQKEFVGIYSPDGTLVFEQTTSGVSSGTALADTADFIIASNAKTTSTDISTSLIQRQNSDTYCTAQVNSLGCVPVLATQGTPGASEPLPFEVSATELLNAKNGLFFFGVQGPASTPFLDGTLCVLPPLARTSIQNTGGTTPPLADCSGALTIDFNAEIPLTPVLAPGVEVWGQFWSREPNSPSGAHLTGGIHFAIAY